MKTKIYFMRSKFTPIWGVVLGICLLMTFHIAQAVRAVPSEHKGLTVSSLGVVNEASMQAQLGLSGYKMQLREIIVEPGGQVARHDHSKKPGLVLTLSGSWVEGRPEGEKAYPDSLKEAIVEDKDTEHWFWNDGTEPARIAVCDIVPAS
jgi:quercetin dioxygenase-like cupin family protein